MESILEKADEERMCDIKPKADEVEKGILEDRVACKGTCKKCLGLLLKNAAQIFVK